MTALSALFVKLFDSLGNRVAAVTFAGAGAGAGAGTASGAAAGLALGAPWPSTADAE